MRRLAPLLAVSALLAAGTAAAEPYGLIGKLTAKPGQREALIAFLLEGSSAMPGCLSYVVAKDAKEPDAVWVTEAWETQAAHDASLKLPSVQAAIAKARPLIAGGGPSYETVPVAGLPPSR